MFLERTGFGAAVFGILINLDAKNRWVDRFFFFFFFTTVKLSGLFLFCPLSYITLRQFSNSCSRFINGT